MYYKIKDMEKIRSLMPPFSFYGTVSKQWYIVAGSIWREVDREYSLSELNQIWDKICKPAPDNSILKYDVDGSKGVVYKVVNNKGKWTCSCPASTFKRGECKHILSLKK